MGACAGVSWCSVAHVLIAPVGGVQDHPPPRRRAARLRPSLVVAGRRWPPSDGPQTARRGRRGNAPLVSGHQLGKLWAFAASRHADLGERSGLSLVGLGCFYCGFPFVLVRLWCGANCPKLTVDRRWVRGQLRRLWFLARGRLPGVPALKGMVASLACLGAGPEASPGPNRRQGFADGQAVTCQRRFPSMPREDLLALAKAQGCAVIWPAGNGFVSTNPKALP